MNISFKLEYRTIWGEDVRVNLSVGTNSPVQIMLHTVDGIIWSGSTEVENPDNEVVTYRYSVYRNGYNYRIETGTMPHVLFPEKGKNEYRQDDWWRDPVRLAGVAIPVFSLRSEGSQGVGDFGDLFTLIDWAEQTGMKAVQILPVNDTTASHTWTDSYPYNGISIYALHPMYLDLRQLGRVDDKAYMKTFEAERKKINSMTQIDYEAVNRLKDEYIRRMYEQDGERVLRSADFRRFFKKNEYWLRPYAAFSYLRDKYSTPDFSQWPEFSQYETTKIEALCRKTKEVKYYYYVQYNLHIQLLRAGNHARRKEIILKGDIPIGISRNSVEAWVEPQYFHMDSQTGAPPDAFSDDGQNWGFPTYNWQRMSLDGYRWWLRRMLKMAEYFSAYRIDHILGFFRIWEIPVPHKSGLMGHFSPALPMTIEEIERYGVSFREEMFLPDKNSQSTYHPRILALKEPTFQSLSEEEQHGFLRLYEDFFYHRHNQFWYDEAMKKLPALTRSSQMIACGEDLGMVPDCVPWVMKDLGILSLEIQSMPKASWTEFGVVKDYPTLSVCTISSHDTPSLRGWWEEDQFRAQRYYNNALGLNGKAPLSMPAPLCERVLTDHLQSPSVLCILTMQDWLSVDADLRNPDALSERINIPVNPHHYWRYRLHLTLEQLLSADDFNHKVSELVKLRN